MDIEALINEKKAAAEAEDFLRAAEIKKQLAAIDITSLENEKKQAAADEDYERAAQLKKQIDLLTLEQSKGKATKAATTTTTTSSSAPTPPKPAPSAAVTPKKPIASTATNSSSDASPSMVSPPGRNKITPDKSAQFAGSSTLLGVPTTPRTGDDLNNNPIKTDPKLKAMIEGLDDIDSYRPFKLWKSSFLNRYEEFLSEEGAKPAQSAYNSFRSTMKSFVSVVKKVQHFVEKGDLTEEKTTVKGRNSLNELNKWLVKVISEERNLIPALSEEERRRGYTKFHLGAVLVRDGFKEHAQLESCCEILNHLKTILAAVADRQIIDEMVNFDRQTKRFRDLMADLGLFEVMLKCWEFNDPEDEFIFVDLKTGAIGAVSIQSCLDKAFIHTVKDDNGVAIAYREALTDPEDRDAVLDLVQEVLQI